MTVNNINFTKWTIITTVCTVFALGPILADWRPCSNCASASPFLPLFLFARFSLFSLILPFLPFLVMSRPRFEAGA